MSRGDATDLDEGYHMQLYTRKTNRPQMKDSKTKTRRRDESLLRKLQTGANPQLDQRCANTEPEGLSNQDALLGKNADKRTQCERKTDTPATDGSEGFVCDADQCSPEFSICCRCQCTYILRMPSPPWATSYFGCGARAPRSWFCCGWAFEVYITSDF